MSELVVIKPDSQLLRPIATPGELIERHKEITVLIRDSLEEGVDYGTIPGAGANKVLKKPGAERLCVAFGCHPTYRIISQDADHDRQNEYYKHGNKQSSTGFYRYVVACDLMRNGVLVGSAIGSCSSMESKYISRPRDVENTILKMAQKRALVAVVLNTFALSDRFTQDIDDTPLETEEAPIPRAPVAPFDPKDDKMASVLANVLEKQGVPPPCWGMISERLTGKFSKDLPAIIKQVQSEYAAELNS